MIFNIGEMANQNGNLKTLNIGILAEAEKLEVQELTHKTKTPLANLFF